MPIRAEVLRLLDECESEQLSGQVILEYRRGDAVGSKVIKSTRYDSPRGPMECLETKANGRPHDQ